MGVSRVPPRPLFVLFVFSLAILRRGCAETVSELCELGIKDKNKVYQYSLVSPRPNFPHGILSEDGFYKVAANGTVLWFQIGSVSIYAGYPVCIALGRPSSIAAHVQDEKSPHAGIIVKMINAGPSHNCSLSVSIVRQLVHYLAGIHILQGSQAFKVHGLCEYSTELKHPLGCARIISASGSGLGWFGTLMIIILCLFGAYFLAGAVYHYSILHVRGIDVIPNLEFWASVPHRMQSLFFSLVRRFRDPSHGHRSSYSPVNF